MNRTAIDDLLGGILSGWYESVADWSPPGQGSRATCTSCAESLLAESLATAEWPHDLVHQLASSLESAALHVFDAIDVTPVEGCEHEVSLECVRRYVSTVVERHALDIADVLEQCVTPRVEEFAATAVARALETVEPDGR